jgi:protein-disulfide isomerase
VKIIEFADFECPGCGNFATVTEPDVRKRIIEPGLANMTFYDFPLPQHKNSRAAHNAAACAADQGKFWEMHDRLFNSQDQWNTQATDNPKPFFEKYASDMGLDAKTWEDSKRKDRGSVFEGVRAYGHGNNAPKHSCPLRYRAGVAFFLG